MLTYIARRILIVIPTLFIISIVTFIIIQLPPGDFFTTLQAEMAETGGGQGKELVEHLQELYGLNEPVWRQYFRWISGFPRLDFGYSLGWNAPVWDVIKGNVAYTIGLGFLSLIFMVVVSVPIGIYSATHQYSPGDIVLSALGFIGISLPGFLLALIWMFVGIVILGVDVGGVASMEFRNAPWSIAKMLDYLNHLWPPVVILGLASTAQLFRIMRSNLLDVLGQQHITTARAKGLREKKVIRKYAVRIAINPLISVMALEVPKIINASILVGIVMFLPTLGPVFLRALRTQDIYMAGTILLFTTVMLMVANLVADVVLAIVDPRIAYD